MRDNDRGNGDCTGSRDEDSEVIAVGRSCKLLEALSEGYPLLSKKELFSRVLCGGVFVNGSKIRDHKRILKKNDTITLRKDDNDFVSRGAHKLSPVLDAWEIFVGGKVFLDVGCATGGFTELLLSKGASFVHAVDSAYNVLAYKIRSDKRVRIHERTNIFSIHRLNPRPHRAVVDVSFRSLRKMLPHILSLCVEGYVVALCKPQFEFASYKAALPASERNCLPQFSGILTEVSIQKKIIFSTIRALEREGAYTHDIIPAGIKGRKGNQEFFLKVRSEATSKDNAKILIAKI